jgi:hypothetical protein
VGPQGAQVLDGQDWCIPEGFCCSTFSADFWFPVRKRVDGCESLVERLLGPATTELFDISGDADEKEQICPKLHLLQLSHAACPGISNICSVNQKHQLIQL